MPQSTWKNDFLKMRYVMDIFLFISFILVCAPKFTGVAIHEWLSFFFLIPFMIHLLLHWDWIKNFPKLLIHNLKGQARFNAIWDLIIYLTMMVVILSGVIVSEVVLPLLGLGLPLSPFWFMIHDTSSNLLIPMLGIHLALHWDWIKTMTVKMKNKAASVKEVK
ncbi:DUF4405 domain-containing protein [Vibrio sp. 1-Bac 57]